MSSPAKNGSILQIQEEEDDQHAGATIMTCHENEPNDQNCKTITNTKVPNKVHDQNGNLVNKQNETLAEDRVLVQNGVSRQTSTSNRSPHQSAKIVISARNESPVGTVSNYGVSHNGVTIKNEVSNGGFKKTAASQNEVSFHNGVSGSTDYRNGLQSFQNGVSARSGVQFKSEHLSEILKWNGDTSPRPLHQEISSSFQNIQSSLSPNQINNSHQSTSNKPILNSTNSLTNNSSRKVDSPFLLPNNNFQPNSQQKSTSTKSMNVPNTNVNTIIPNNSSISNSINSSINSSSVNKSNFNSINTMNSNPLYQHSLNQNSLNQNSLNQNSSNQNSLNQNSLNQNSMDQNSLNQNSLNHSSLDSNSLNQNSIKSKHPVQTNSPTLIPNSPINRTLQNTSNSSPSNTPSTLLNTPKRNITTNWNTLNHDHHDGSEAHGDEVEIFLHSFNDKNLHFIQSHSKFQDEVQALVYVTKRLSDTLKQKIQELSDCKSLLQQYSLFNKLCSLTGVQKPSYFSIF